MSEQSEDPFVRGFNLGRATGRAEARDAVVTVQAEAGYDPAIDWSEIGNEYAEGWVDHLSLILAAIDALQTSGKEG